MATFNIYGCCICRDLFGFVSDNQHEIIHFLQSSSQLANFLYPTKPQREMTEDDFLKVSHISDFKKKCIINDYNKTVLDYFVEPSDYFILDLINIANTNLLKQTFNGGYQHYFTYSAWFRNAYKAGLEDFFEGSTLDKIDRLGLIEHFGTDEVLDKMIQWLTVALGYREDQIILIENKRASLYTDGEVIDLFSPGTRETVNTYMDDIYNSFKEKCPGCHVIKAPYGSYSDTRHPWGLTDLHYTKDYYDYLYLCVNAIVNNNASQKEIEKLNEKYSRLNEKSLIYYLRNTINKLKEESMVDQQLLQGDFLLQVPLRYVASKGAASYKSSNVSNDCIPLKCFTEISDYDVPLSKTVSGRYVNFYDCIRGVCGNDKPFGERWRTVGRSVCVIIQDHSIVLKHNGTGSKAQMNLIQILDSPDFLRGKTVTFSAYARVLEFSDDNGRGGTIAIINDNGYNRGVFYAKTEFRNTEWKKIFVTTTLPLSNEDFVGVTVCLRANAGSIKHASVEFCMPRLELTKF